MTGTAAEVLARCAELGELSEEPDRLTRRFATPAHVQAGELVVGWMAQAGMATRRDAIGNVIGRYGAERSHEPGKFWGPHGIWTDSEGSIYVAEVLEGARLQKFARKK